uniref:Pdh1 n=1 Tax=Arundo donax TaxID=35708 RepID=A0A0A8Y4P1_ARUDO
MGNPFSAMLRARFCPMTARPARPILVRAISYLDLDQGVLDRRGGLRWRESRQCGVGGEEGTVDFGVWTLPVCRGF